MDNRFQSDRQHYTSIDCAAVQPDVGAAGASDTAAPVSEMAGPGADIPSNPQVVSIAPSPFVWQRGRRLLLLDEEPPEWILAELEFMPSVCRYREIRRARYRWEGEAAGALLSRALASGTEALADSAESLNDWLARHRYGAEADPPVLGPTIRS